MTAPSIAVRELGHDDLEDLLALYAHLHESDDPLPERARVSALWDTLVRAPEHLYLGGFVDGVLVSACNAAVIANLTRGARPYAVVENVVTHADHRRRGVGRRVLRELLERCWAQGCYKVMLMSAMGRSGAHGFYEALGFEAGAKQAFVLTRR
jgi:GNAT superfamily N-acetyltransferase